LEPIVLQLVESTHSEIDVSQIKMDTENVKTKIENINRSIEKINELTKIIESTPEKALGMTILASKINTLKIIVYAIYLPLIIAVISYLLFLK